MKRFCVLLAEDNPDLRALYAHILFAHGYEVVAVEDGEAAVTAIQRKVPDVVVTDIMMPKMNGLELIDWLRQQDTFVHIPIIAITAFTDKELEEARKAGADVAIGKPVDEQIYYEIYNALSQT